jgi:uncharacterized protein
MKIALIGATGFVGSHILAEALERGHTVTAIVRHPERVPAHERVVAVHGDVSAAHTPTALFAGHDAVISAYSPALTEPDVYERLVAGCEAIIEATKAAGVKRLLVVGGAGSLEASGGMRVVDEPDFPEEWRPVSLGMCECLRLLRGQPDLDWTFLCPAEMLEPGERIGDFRLGTDSLLTDGEGRSRISVEDYAVAMIDELEEANHSRQRFCVAY